MIYVYNIYYIIIMYLRVTGGGAGAQQMRLGRKKKMTPRNNYNMYSSGCVYAACGLTTLLFSYFFEKKVTFDLPLYRSLAKNKTIL